MSRVCTAGGKFHAVHFFLVWTLPCVTRYWKPQTIPMQRHKIIQPLLLLLLLSCPFSKCTYEVVLQWPCDHNYDNGPVPVCSMIKIISTFTYEIFILLTTSNYENKWHPYVPASKYWLVYIFGRTKSAKHEVLKRKTTHICSHIKVR